MHLPWRNDVYLIREIFDFLVCTDLRSLVVMIPSQLRTLQVNVLGQAEDTQTMQCGPAISHIDRTERTERTHRGTVDLELEVKVGVGVGVSLFLLLVIFLFKWWWCGGCNIGYSSDGDSGGGGTRWSDDMIYQCSEVPGNISRENQTCCDSTAVFREPGGAMVRVMGGPAQ